MERENKIEIDLCNSVIKVKIKKSKRLKSNIYFEIKQENNTPFLEVKSPYSINNKSLLNILTNNTANLEKLYKKYLDGQTKQQSLEKDDEMLLFGKTINIVVVKSKENTFEYKDNSLIIKIDFPYSKKIKEQVREMFYKQQAQKVITPLLYFWQDKMKLYANRVNYRKTKRQWGSCSSLNNISLNTHLCLLPKDVVEYVIIHELSHIKHKNHSKDFWNLVNKYSPNYKELRALLKEYGRFL